MAIPGFQSIALPLLKYIGEHEERSLRQCIEGMAIVLTSTKTKELNYCPPERKPSLTIV